MLEIEAEWDNATNVAITAAHTYNLFYYVDEKKTTTKWLFLGVECTKYNQILFRGDPE